MTYKIRCEVILEPSTVWILLHELYRLPLFIKANLFVSQRAAAARQDVRHALGGEATSECTGPPEPAAGKDWGPKGLHWAGMIAAQPSQSTGAVVTNDSLCTCVWWRRRFCSIHFEALSKHAQGLDLALAESKKSIILWRGCEQRAK